MRVNRRERRRFEKYDVEMAGANLRAEKLRTLMPPWPGGADFAFGTAGATTVWMRNIVAPPLSQLPPQSTTASEKRPA